MMYKNVPVPQQKISIEISTIRRDLYPNPRSTIFSYEDSLYLAHVSTSRPIDVDVAQALISKSNVPHTIPAW